MKPTKSRTLKRILQVSLEDMEECIVTQESQGYELVTMAWTEEGMVMVFKPEYLFPTPLYDQPPEGYSEI